MPLPLPFEVSGEEMSGDEERASSRALFSLKWPVMRSAEATQQKTPTAGRPVSGPKMANVAWKPATVPRLLTSVEAITGAAMPARVASVLE